MNRDGAQPSAAMGAPLQPDAAQSPLTAGRPYHASAASAHPKFEDVHWRRRSRGLLAFRVGLGLVCLSLLSIKGASGPLMLRPFWWAAALGLIAIINGPFWLVTRWLTPRRNRRPPSPPMPEDVRRARRLNRRRRALLALQIAVDLVLFEALIYLTGGAASIFVFLPFICILTASVVLSGYRSLLYASAATVMLAAVSLAYSLSYLHVLRLPFITRDWVIGLWPTLPRTLALVVGQGVALHVVAFLGGDLAARLRRETHLKEEILDTIGEGLIVADADLRVVFVNREAVRLLGFQSADQFIGRRWDEIFRRRGDRQVRQMLRPDAERAEPASSDADSASSTGGSHAAAGMAGHGSPPRSVAASESSDALPRLAPHSRSRVIEFDHRDLGKLYLSIKTRPFRRRHDVQGGVVAIFHDITAEKTMEQVQERAERLQEISLVAAGIAHELRNPLASIRGCVQELARIESTRMPLANNTSEKEARKVERLSEIVTSETDRLDKIITEFLNFARMRPPRPMPLDLHLLIEEVIVLLQTGGVRLRNVEIETDVPTGLSVIADRDQLKQVLLNLARNAVDAMPAGGCMTLTACDVPRLPGQGVSVHEEGGAPPPAPGRAVRIEVIDTGCGIGPDDVKQLFRPFFTTKQTGTGMGLSIVDRIVRAHGGHVEVDSQLGIGTTFRLWFPSDTPVRPAASGPFSTRPSAPVRVLTPNA